jgi:hypothetical protein
VLATIRRHKKKVVLILILLLTVFAVWGIKRLAEEYKLLIVVLVLAGGYFLINVFYSIQTGGFQANSLTYSLWKRLPFFRRSMVGTVEILGVETGVLEQGQQSWKFSWTLRLRNNSARDQVLSADLVWLDEQGQPRATLTESGLNMATNSEVTFSGACDINSSVASLINSIRAEVHS